MRSHLAVTLGAALLLLPAACSKKGDGGDKGAGKSRDEMPDKYQDVMKYEAEQVKKNLPEMRTQAEAGDQNALTLCPGTLGDAERLAADERPEAKQLAEQAREFCEFEGPIAIAEKALATLAEKHAADPKGLHPSECSATQTALGKIKRKQEDPRVAAAQTGFTEHCAFLIKK
jgi:hypothetical protein